MVFEDDQSQNQKFLFRHERFSYKYAPDDDADYVDVGSVTFIPRETLDFDIDFLKEEAPPPAQK